MGSSPCNFCLSFLRSLLDSGFILYGVRLALDALSTTRARAQPLFHISCFISSDL